MTPTPEESVDERSKTIIEEFRQHWRGCCEAAPGGKFDQRVAYEGWAIQKIAGLQLVVEDLTRHVDALVALWGTRVKGG